MGASSGHRERRRLILMGKPGKSIYDEKKDSNMEKEEEQRSPQTLLRLSQPRACRQCGEMSEMFLTDKGICLFCGFPNRHVVLGDFESWTGPKDGRQAGGNKE